MLDFDIYFDESGDPGWILDAPFRNGGSSQYFTIAYVLVPKEKSLLIDRFITKFYRSYKLDPEIEQKGANFKGGFTLIAAKSIAKFIKKNTEIIIGAITITKSNVPSNIIDNLSDNNSHILYNYMLRNALVSKLQPLDKVDIFPDKRSVPKGSQNSCPDLLKTKLWFELNSDVQITYEPQDSYKNKRLMFIDWVANFVFRNYEDKETKPYEIIRPYLKEDFMYF